MNQKAQSSPFYILQIVTECDEAPKPCANCWEDQESSKEHSRRKGQGIINDIAISLHGD